MLVIGAWGVRMKGIEDFHLAGRTLRPVILIGTFCATIVGASSTIGMAGLGFSKGLPGAWWMLSGALGLLVMAAFFAMKIRATGCYTLPELVGSFYGEKTRIAASVLIVISWLGVIAVQIVASGKVLSALFGGDETLFMAACAAVFIVYTMHGGQKSVVRTDLVQFLIIIVGIVVLFFAAYNSVGHELLFRQAFPTSTQMGGCDIHDAGGGLSLPGRAGHILSSVLGLQPKRGKGFGRDLGHHPYPSGVSNRLLGNLRQVPLSRSIAGAVPSLTHDGIAVAGCRGPGGRGSPGGFHVLGGHEPYDRYIHPHPGPLQEGQTAGRTEKHHDGIALSGPDHWSMLFGAGHLFGQHHQNATHCLYDIYRRPASACGRRIL